MPQENASRRTSRFPLVLAFGLVFIGAAPGCRKTPARIQVGAVEKCESGIENALRQASASERDRLYYQGCAGVYAEAACSDAFRNAAALPDEKRLVAIGVPCRTAYCPILDDRGAIEACAPDFQPTDENLKRAWPGLHNAILKYDARGYAPRLTRMMLGFYTRALNWQKAPAGSAAASAPAGSEASPPGSASAGAASAAPSASTALPGPR